MVVDLLLQEGYQNITLEDILEMRENKNDGYYFFYDCILRCVVGRIKWKRIIRENRPISELVSCSDEAFGLLVLENGWNKWQQIHDQQIVDAKAKKQIKSKYTNDEREGNSSFDGWKSTGLQRYNELVYHVIKNRKSKGGKSFDKNYNEDLINSCAVIWKRKSRAKGQGEDVQKREEICLFDPLKESEDEFTKRMDTCEQMNQENNHNNSNNINIRKRYEAYEDEEDSEEEEISEARSYAKRARHRSLHHTAV